VTPNAQNGGVGVAQNVPPTNPNGNNNGNVTTAGGASAPPSANIAAANQTWDPFQLRPGDKLDALDTERIWRHSEVMEASPTHILVHYSGWQPKW
jgi:hypothetical protein